jgi:hypothetical protein
LISFRYSSKEKDILHFMGQYRGAMKESPITYEIRVEGLVDGLWTEWFNGMEITYVDNAETILMGGLPDQTALHGVLNRIRDLGLNLISVRRME